jgi:peptidoglycan/LPS O-acetylase OafA/YrhL
VVAGSNPAAVRAAPEARSDVKPRLEAFDGLRACAAGSVLAFHVCQSCAVVAAGAIGAALAGLKVGVTIFFVLSGFLLYLPYARSLRAGGQLPCWRSFTRRRLVRILPAYWTALLILGHGPLAAGVTAATWWRYFGLLQIYSAKTVITTGLGGAWSLCVELSFYALLPLLAAGMGRLTRGQRPRGVVRHQLWVLAALAADCLVLRFALTGSLAVTVPAEHLVLATSLPGLFDWFCIGMALAVLASAWEAGDFVLPRLAWLSARPGLSVLAAIACYATVVITHPGDVFLSQYGLVNHVALGATAGFLVLAAVGTVHVERDALLTRALRGRVMVWLGSVSYGIYLWHLAIIWALVGTTGFGRPQSVLTVIGMFMVVIAIAIALGAISRYVIERPFQRLSAKLRPPRAAVAEA